MASRSKPKKKNTQLATNDIVWTKPKRKHLETEPSSVVITPVSGTPTEKSIEDKKVVFYKRAESRLSGTVICPKVTENNTSE